MPYLVMGLVEGTGEVPEFTPTPAGTGTGGTSILLHFDNNLTDSSNNNMTFTNQDGTVQFSTDSKFGTHSMRGAQLGAYPQTGSHPDFNLSGVTNPAFSTDMWVKFNTVTTNNYFWEGTGARFHLVNGNVRLYISGNVIDYPWAPTTLQWYHIALERQNNNNWNFYIDGIKRQTVNDNHNTSINALAIGGSTSQGRFDGWIDEFRMTRFAPYGGVNFTPPTAPYQLV